MPKLPSRIMKKTTAHVPVSSSYDGSVITKKVSLVAFPDDWEDQPKVDPQGDGA